MMRSEPLALCKGWGLKGSLFCFRFRGCGGVLEMAAWVAVQRRDGR